MSEELKVLVFVSLIIIIIGLSFGGFILMMNYIEYVSDGWC